MRVISLVLSVAMLASAFVYLGNEKMNNVSAADGGRTKPYMEYIVQRLIDGVQEEFNILEIVPYKGQGEFRYYASDDEVADALEADQAKLETLYKELGNTKSGDTWSNANNWQNMNAPYSEYSYQMRYNSANDKFEVQGPDTFINNVVYEYDGLISEMLNVNTVEANKLTEADIKKADLIVINTGSSNDNAINLYKALSGDTEQTVFTKDGIAITNGIDITYNTFEKVLASSVPEEPDDPDIPDNPEVTSGNIYFKNDGNWGNVYAYYWSDTDKNMVEWPGEQMVPVEGQDQVYSVEIESDVEYIIFNNGASTQKNQKDIIGFEKIYYGGEWLDYPIIENPEIYTVTWPSDENIVCTGEVDAVQNTLYSVVLSAKEGYVILDEITVTIGETEYKDFTYNSNTGEISIPSSAVTGNIVINATAKKAEELTKYTVTLPTDVNIVCDGATEIFAGQRYNAVLTVAEGYALPEAITVTVGGSEYNDFTYDAKTGAVVIPATGVTGDIVISATATKIEVSEFAYISRDMSWNICEKLLDYVINGKNVEMPDGTVLTNVITPVVINNYGTANLPKDSNIYKLMLIYRTCAADRWNILKEYISTKDSEGNKYINEAGLVTPAMNVSGAGFTADAVKNWENGTNSSVKALFDKVAPSGKTIEGITLSAYRESDSSVSNILTDDYWVYSDVKALKPSESSNYILSGTESEMNEFITRAEYDRTGRSSNYKYNTKTAWILEYLLGAKSSQVYSFTDKVRVLEIQPCNCFEYKSLDKIKELGRKLLRKDWDRWSSANDYSKYITIDYVTPNALNGMTVDIASEYDLVIIGDNIGSSSDVNRLTQQDGKTIYNDRNLNGYIYLAFGDLMKVSTYALGYLPDEYVEVPSGASKNGLRAVNENNEHVWTSYLYDTLTKNKYYVVKEMRDYYVTKSKVKKISNNSDKIDNESFYLDHYLGNTRISDNDITDITKEKLINYVKTGNPIVVADSIYNADRTKIYPTSDMYDFAKNILGNRDNKNVLRKDAIGKAVAYLGTKAPRINFINGDVTYIKRDASNNYTTVTETKPIKPVEPTYIGDSNGAGGIISSFNNRDLYYKFNITGQVGSTYLVKLLVDKNNDGVYNDVNSGATSDDNEVYYAEEVKLNRRTVTYEIKSALAKNFIGMLAWRIDVIQLDSDGNETVYKVSEKGYSAIRNETIRTLSVLQIAPYPADDRYNENDLEMDRGTFKNLMDAVESVVGYDISVKVMSAEQFANQYKEPGQKYTKGDLGTDRDKLGYDMVVLGFKDSYGGMDINNDYGALDNILDYMDAGKAVLFTHDTVSWRSTPNYVAGYYDRYNNFIFNWPGSIYDIKSDGNTGNQTRYGDTCFNLTINFRKRVGMDKYGVTLTNEERIAQNKEVPMYAPVDENDTDYRPSYMTTDVVREIQGFNNWNTCRMNFCYKGASSYTSSGRNFYWLFPYSDFGYDTNDGASVMYKTQKIVQLNEGPITMYPYNVGTSVSIKETHGQYFELDMEDEDIVVWYTLDAGSSYYTRTYKDAGNNYYIYSKNNITYSGAGHSDIRSSTHELKLFVNTVIKAIAGGNNGPTVTVTNGGEISSEAGNYVVYASSSDLASAYEIDFRADDSDLISYETAGGNINLVGEFAKAEIYWLESASSERLIKSGNYRAKGKNGTEVVGNLKNGIIQEIRLGETDLVSMTAQDGRNALDVIEETVKSGTAARFKIVVVDSSGMESQVFVQLHVRDLFEMN